MRIGLAVAHLAYAVGAAAADDLDEADVGAAEAEPDTAEAGGILSAEAYSA